MSTGGYTALDFKEATDEMLRLGVTLSEIAEEFDASESSVRQARINPTKRGYRRPPPAWRQAVIRIAKRRGGELLKLVERLAQELEG